MPAAWTKRQEWTTLAAAIASGLLVALVAGYAVAAMEIRTGSNPMTSSGSSPVPISAIAVGTIAITTFVITTNVLGLKPARWMHLASGVMIGAATVLFAHRFCYHQMLVDGRPVSDGIGFLTYAKSIVTNCAVPNGPQLQGMEFGNLGYLRATAQVLAFAVGGWAVAPYIRLGQPAPADATR